MISFDSEKVFEDFLCDNLDKGYNPISDCEIDRYIRQPNFDAYGTGDILVFSPDNPDSYSVKLYELKNEVLKIQHVMQIARYRKFFIESDPDFNDRDYEFTLVVKNADSYPGDLIFLVNQIDWLTVYEFWIDPGCGICFHEIGTYTQIDKEEDRLKAYNALEIGELLRRRDEGVDL